MVQYEIKGKGPIAIGIILEDSKGNVLFQLRDNKSWIHYPNHWSIFTGGLEASNIILATEKTTICPQANIQFFAPWIHDECQLPAFLSVKPRTLKFICFYCLPISRRPIPKTIFEIINYMLRVC